MNEDYVIGKYYLVFIDGKPRCLKLTKIDKDEAFTKYYLEYDYARYVLTVDNAGDRKIEPQKSVYIQS